MTDPLQLFWIRMKSAELFYIWRYAGRQDGSLAGKQENNLSVREMLILRTDIQGLYTLSQSCYNCYNSIY